MKTRLTVQLNVVLGLFVFKQIKRCALGNEQQCAELKLTFRREVLHGEMILPVVGERLVELTVLLVGNIIRRSGPDWLGLIQLLVFAVLLLDLFLLFLCALFGIGIFANVFNLGLIALLFLLIGSGLGLVVRHLHTHTNTNP